MPRGLRSVPDGIDQELWDFLNQLRNQVLEGQRFGYPYVGSAGAGGVPSSSGQVPALPGGGSGSGSTEPDLTPPPTPSGVVVTGGFASIFVETDAPTFTVGNGYNRTIVYGAKYSGTGPLPTFSSAVIVYEFVGEIGAFPSGDLGTQWHLWLRWRTNDGVLSVSPSGGANGHQVTVGKVGTSDLGPLIVEAGNLASGAVSARVAAEKAVTLTAFAAGIEPVTIVTGSTLPTTKLTETIYLTGTGKLYRWVGTAYTAAVATSDLSGVITAPQLSVSIGGGNLVPNANFKKHAGGFPYGWTEYNNGGTARTFQVASGGLFGTNFVRVTADAATTNTLGISTQTGVAGGGVQAWQPGLTYIVSFYARSAGSLAAGKKMQGLYSNMGFPSATELASPALINGVWQRYVWRVSPADNVHTPSGELYLSWDLSGGTLPAGAAIDICAVQVEQGDMVTAFAPKPSEILPDTITATEIADNAVTTPKLIAGAVIAGKIAAGAVETDKLAANAVTAQKIQAGAITTSKLLVAPVSLCPDPFFTDEAWWTATSFQFWYFEGYPPYMNVPKHVSLWAGAAVPPGTARGHVWSAPIACPAPGTVVRLRARMWNGSNQPIYTQCSFADAAGAGIDEFRLTAPAGAAVQDYSAQFTVPPNSATMTFIVYNEGGTTFTGFAMSSAVMLDIAASAELIVDGAISTDKLAANAVTAGKIQAGAIGADQIAANAIRTQHLLVTGPGSLLPDGTFEDQENWGITYGGTKLLFKAVSDAPAGRYVAYCPAGSIAQHVAWRPGGNLLKTIPVDLTRRYRFSFYYRVVGATSGAQSYATVAQIDSAGNLIGNNSGHVFYGWTIGATAPGAWTRVEFLFGAGAGSYDLNAACRFVTPSFLLNWENAGGEVQIADVRIVPQVDASLIVDGAIIAGKLAAGAIAVGSAAIQDGAIRNALIENLAVDDAKIANLAVGKLTAGSLKVGDFIQSTGYVAGSQGWRIHGNGGAEFAFAMIRGTLSAAQIAAGSITADKIDSRGLTIKDASGNIIFGASQSLDWSRIVASSGWLNSNVTVDANGNLQGIGSGAGTTVSNSALASSTNLLYNGDFSAGTNGWTYNGTAIITLSNQGVNYSSDWRLAPAAARGTDVFWAEQGAHVGGGGYADWESPQVPVVPGSRYCASGYFGAHRCDSTIYIACYNAGGGLFVYQYGDAPHSVTTIAANEKTGGQTIDGYKRLRLFFVAPAGTAYVRILLRKWDTQAGQSSSYIFVTRFMVEEVGLVASLPGAYVPNGLTDATAVRATNKITAANVSTYIASAAIGWAYIGDLVINTGGGIRSGKTTYGSGTGWLIEYNNGTPRLDIGDANQYLRWTGTALDIKLNKITLTGTTPSGGSFPKNDTITRSLGTCTITASGGTPPYAYSWIWSADVQIREYQARDPDTRGYASFSSNVATFTARGDNDCIVTVFASCTVTDQNGLAAVFDTAAGGTFGSGVD